MIISQTLKKIERELAACGIENAKGEAKIFVSEICGLSDTALFAHRDAEIGDEKCAHIFSLVERRKLREPLQYIWGKAWFYGREFSVRQGVLIPRPETELLIEAALECEFQNFLDWGTGSGCIAGTILCEREQVFCVAAEKNPRSILCAWKNFKNLGVLDRATIWHSRTPEDIPIALQSLDLVVSNPPYIPTDEIARLMPEVTHEPRLALDGGDDGLYFYKILIKNSSRWLAPGGKIIFEIGAGQSEFFSKNNFDNLSLEYIRKDYAGIDRVVCLRNSSISL